MAAVLKPKIERILQARSRLRAWALESPVFSTDQRRKRAYWKYLTEIAWQLHREEHGGR